jgi:hypothetical protein
MNIKVGSSFKGSVVVNCGTMQRFQSARCCKGLCSGLSWSPRRTQISFSFIIAINMSFKSYADVWNKSKWKIAAHFPHPTPISIQKISKITISFIN